MTLDTPTITPKNARGKSGPLKGSKYHAPRKPFPLENFIPDKTAREFINLFLTAENNERYLNTHATLIYSGHPAREADVSQANKVRHDILRAVTRKMQHMQWPAIWLYGREASTTDSGIHDHVYLHIPSNTLSEYNTNFTIMENFIETAYYTAAKKHGLSIKAKLKPTKLTKLRTFRLRMKNAAYPVKNLDPNNFLAHQIRKHLHTAPKTTAAPLAVTTAAAPRVGASKHLRKLKPTPLPDTVAITLDHPEAWIFRTTLLRKADHESRKILDRDPSLADDTGLDGDEEPSGTLSGPEIDTAIDRLTTGSPSEAIDEHEREERIAALATARAKATISAASTESPSGLKPAIAPSAPPAPHPAPASPDESHGDATISGATAITGPTIPGAAPAPGSFEASFQAKMKAGNAAKAADRKQGAAFYKTFPGM